MRLEDLCIFLSRGKSPKYSEEPNSYPVFAQKCNLKDGGISLKQARFLDALTIEKWDPIYYLRENDILINSTGTGTVGRTRLFKDSYLGNYAFTVPDSHVSVIRLIEFLNPQYIFSVISSDVFQQYLENNLAGSTNQKELYIDVIGKMWIPLPGIIEQDFIAQKIEHSFDILINLDKHSSGLSSYIKTVKSKILELAMQGKLVPQDPTDEPAAEMLKRINPKAKIISDNPHYPQLPDNWAYISIDDVNSYESKSINPSVMPNNIFELYSVPVFSTGNPEIVLGKEIGSTKQKVEKGDVLLCKINPHLNRVWEIEKNSINVQIASSEWIVIRSTEIEPTYLKFYFESPRFRELLCSQVSGVGGSLTRAQPSVVKSYLIPIPPANEQKRICDAIKSYLHILDDIILHLNN